MKWSSSLSAMNARWVGAAAGASQHRLTSQLYKIHPKAMNQHSIMFAFFHRTVLSLCCQCQLRHSLRAKISSPRRRRRVSDRGGWGRLWCSTARQVDDREEKLTVQCPPAPPVSHLSGVNDRWTTWIINRRRAKIKTTSRGPFFSKIKNPKSFYYFCVPYPDLQFNSLK